MAPLHPVEARVLGALVEKEITTPEYYPLTLNALVAACNQKSNRDPVVSYDDDTVTDALESLRARGLTTVVTGAGSRVPKYGHRFAEALNLGRRELALLDVLLLRGRQTVGELRDRAERLHRFDDLAEAESVLQRLAERDPPLAIKLPRPPGGKEPRWAHLLCGPVEEDAAPAAPEPSARADRLAALEAEVAHLRDTVRSLEEQFALFRRQFE